MVERAVSRAGSFGPSLTEYDQPVAGSFASTLAPVTAAFSGTSVPHNFGTFASTLPGLVVALSGTVANPGDVAGNFAAVLTPITAVFSGVMAPAGTFDATLPGLQTAFVGEVAQAITGTFASTLASLQAAFIGDAGAIPAGIDPYAPAVYKTLAKRRRRKVKEAADLKRRLRQLAGLEPPDPDEPEQPPGPLPGPFWLKPDLATGPLRERLATLEDELAEIDRQRLKLRNAEAVRAVLLADSANPDIGPDPELLEMFMRQIQAAGGNVLSFAKELQELVGAANGANDQSAAVNESLQQMMAGMAQQQQMLGQLAQALVAMVENQNALMVAVKAPRRKRMNVTRDGNRMITGAEVLEEVDA